MNYTPDPELAKHLEDQAVKMPEGGYLLDDAEWALTWSNCRIAHPNETQPELERRVAYYLIWSHYGIPQAGKERGIDLTNARRVQVLSEATRRIKAETLPELQAAVVAGLSDVEAAVNETIATKLDVLIQNSFTQQAESERRNDRWRMAVSDTLEHWDGVSNSFAAKAKKAIIAVLVMLGLLLAAIIALGVLSLRAHAQIDVIQFQDSAGSVVKTFGGPFKIKCSTNLTCTASGSTLTMVASSTGSVAWSALTAGTNSNAGTFAMSGNTLDLTAATLVKLRVAGGLTSSTNGDLGYDTTNKNWHIWGNAVDNFVGIVPASITVVNGHLVTWSLSGGVLTLNDGGAVPAAGVSSVSGDGALISNSGSTGAVTLTVGNALAHKFWGNNTGSTQAGSFMQLACGDLSNAGTLCSSSTDFMEEPASNGLVAKTAANTSAARTISTADSTHVSVSNGDGVAGNPTLDTGSNIPTQASNGAANQIATYSGANKALVPATTLPTAAMPALTGAVTTSAGAVATSPGKIDVLDSSRSCQAAGANSTTYTCNLSPAITAYVTGTHYGFKADVANTAASTINFNAVGAISIKKAAGGITTDVVANDFRAGQWVDLVYDGTNMQMQSTLGNAAITTINPGSLAGPTVTFAVGTSGTDFGVAGASNTITYNLPDASASNRGAVTIAGQTFAGSKTFNATIVAGSAGASIRTTADGTTAKDGFVGADASGNLFFSNWDATRGFTITSGNIFNDFGSLEINAHRIGGRYYIKRFSGADFGAQLTACLAAIPTGGICDATGMTDGSVSITTAISALANQGIEIGPGVRITFSGSGAITFNSGASWKCTMMGITSTGCIITNNTTALSPFLIANGAVGVIIENVGFEGNNRTNALGPAIDFLSGGVSSNRNYFRNISISFWKGIAIRLQDLAQDNHFENVTMGSVGDDTLQRPALLIDGASNSNHFISWQIDSPYYACIEDRATTAGSGVNEWVNVKCDSNSATQGTANFVASGTALKDRLVNFGFRTDKTAAATLSAPAGAPSIACSTSGGSLAGGVTYFVYVTFNNWNGETTVSPEASCAMGATAVGKVTVTAPTLTSGIFGYTVYDSTTTGTATKKRQDTSGACKNIAGVNCVITVLAAGAAPPGANTATVPGPCIEIDGAVTDLNFVSGHCWRLEAAAGTAVRQTNAAGAGVSLNTVSLEGFVTGISDVGPADSNAYILINNIRVTTPKSFTNQQTYLDKQGNLSGLNIVNFGSTTNSSPTAGDCWLASNILQCFLQSSTNGGFIYYDSGGTNNITEQTSGTITSYTVNKPLAAGSGVQFGNNSSNTITQSFSGDGAHAVSQLAKTAAVTTFTLCAATAGTACGQAGQYRISYNFYGSGTACSAVTAGSVGLNLTWTDTNAVAHTTISLPLWDQKSAAMTNGLFNFNTALGTEGASGSYVISTNGTIIQAATTYTACTTGTGTYNLKMAVEQLQ